jgi:crotonobetainyl-CoA:carnitine CoA-transferase CaiB-like acyl-CoA transferase
LLAVACGNDRQFARLCDVVGEPELARDTRFLRNADRVAHRVDLIQRLEARLAGRAAADWQAALTLADVPAGEVKDIEHGITLASALGLDPVTQVPGGTPQIAHPVHYSAFSPTPPTAPPELGQHSEEVRRWLTVPTARTATTTQGTE